MNILEQQQFRALEARVARLENLQQDPAAYKGQSEREMLLDQANELREDNKKLNARIVTLDGYVSNRNTEIQSVQDECLCMKNERDFWKAKVHQLMKAKRKAKAKVKTKRKSK